MLGFLDLLYLGAMMVANITLYAEHDLQYPDLGEVAAISFHREWWRDEGKCRFRGLLVPYARTWEEETKNAFLEAVLPPEPDKTAGVAVVVNKKECPGKEPEAIFRVASQVGERRVMKGLFKVPAADLGSIPEAERPLWLPQVIEIIEKNAATNPDARDFLDFTQQALEAAEAAKAESDPLVASKMNNN